MERFARVLERLKSLPEHVNTILLADSNGHKIKGRALDPEYGTTWVLSSGGLCLVAAVHALKQHSRVYPNINQVNYHIGVNDELHKTQHIHGERPKYLAALKAVTAEMFPNATMRYILPFNGGRISRSTINSLKEDIAQNIPDCKIYHPPDMKSNFTDGVHINGGGITKFIKFLQAYIVPRRPISFSAESGKRSGSSTYAQSLSFCESSITMHNSENVHNSSPRAYPGQLGDPQQSSAHSEEQLERPNIDKHLIEAVTKEVISALMKNNILRNGY